MLYTTDASGNLKAFNLLNISDAFGTERKSGTSETYYLYTEDLKGSTVNVLDNSASRVVSYWYDDFGEVTENKASGYSSFDNELQYTGAVYDASTGLLYLNARFYDPQTGRFISRDTYRGEQNDPKTWHLYLYCANNPVNYVDPSGHSFLSMISGAAGIALCVISYATPYRRWKVAASLGIGIFQIGIAWRDYTKAEKSIKRKYGKKSTKYRRIHNFNQTMFRLAVLSAGTTVVLSALGLKYKTLSNKIGIILLDFGLARSISLFGVTYDLASLLSAGVKRKKRMPFKSK